MTTRYDTPEMAVLWGEEAKFNSWLLVEKTVAQVQAGLGIIPRPAARRIQRASFKLAEIERFEKETNHDVIAFTRSVARSVGSAGKYVHYGLTSYDVVDTALSLRCLSALDLIELALGDLRVEAARLALEYKHTPMIGRTHGVHAEPITFGLKCLSWFAGIGRAIEFVRLAHDRIGFGKLSGAVGAFTQQPVKVEELVLKRLGLKPEPVSTQVIPRDRHAFMLSVLALAATELELIATEIRNLQRTEIGEVAEPFGRRQRGSSAMPHKKNPIICERVVSLARVIRSYALVGMESVPLWHERDLTNSAAERIAIPGAFTLLHYITRKLTAVLAGLVVRPDRMETNLTLAGGTYFSQALMLALVKAGMDKDRAYQLVQELSFQAVQGDTDLPSLARASREVTSRLSSAQLDRVFDARRLLSQVGRIYRRCGLENPRKRV
ncbi:MAG: adenylosuccinate lyase [candidate division WOR-3 bacterium]